MSTFNRDRGPLPYGRGNYTGKDSYVAQNESFSTRQSQLDKDTGKLLRGLQWAHNIDSLAGANYAANLVQFYYLGELQEVHTIAQARLQVTTNAAATSFSSAFYRLDKQARLEGGPRLFRVAGSTVVFTAAAVARVDIKTDFTLTPGIQYFLGFVASSIVPACSSYTGTVANLFKIPSVTTTGVSLPGEVRLINTTPQTTLTSPDILFLSADFAQFLL